MRKWLFLSHDLLVMALSPFIALFIRNDYWQGLDQVYGMVPYAIFSVAASAFLFYVLGTNKVLWRYVSLPDFLRIIAGVTGAILIALVLSFIFFRLDGVARSIPFIQWALAISTIVIMRLVARAVLRVPARKIVAEDLAERDHVLVVGLNPVSELYLRCVSDLGAGRVVVEGLLNEQRGTVGRLLYGHQVIGTPSDLPQILAKYVVHGVRISHVVVCIPFRQLSQNSQDVLRHWEKSGAIKLDMFEERLGFGRRDQEPVVRLEKTSIKDAEISKAVQEETAAFCHNGYLPFKRMLDVVGSVVLMVVCAPLIVVAALLVAIDLGLPLIFWQQRPGLLGKPLRLYKFRTMAAAHDKYGNRISDEHRVSIIGKFLRRTRLDELPQLYHVFRGDMSFVGPRPLLPVDIPENGKQRLNMRPGITGWAQVNGGHSVPANEKMALDIWYLNNVSFWLDIKIMIQTVHVAIFGEKINRNAIKVAEREFLDILRLRKLRKIEGNKRQVA